MVADSVSVSFFYFEEKTQYCRERKSTRLGEQLKYIGTVI